MRPFNSQWGCHLLGGVALGFHFTASTAVILVTVVTAFKSIENQVYQYLCTAVISKKCIYSKLYRYMIIKLSLS